MQVKVLLCYLLPRFKFQQEEGHIATYTSTSVTLKAKYGMNMIVKPRQ